ncbi:MAG TPA: hypothetical protein VFK11_00735 [Candidatus Saccharimonadales bacterium]|nr:hypothetical protein [Candidatus Saccharimonadales bacterium]
MNMPNRGKMTGVVDGLLKFAVFGGVITAGLVAPNSLKVLEKPAQKYFNKLDKRKREREYRKILRYMKANGLIKGDYEHGLQLTEKGRERALKVEIEDVFMTRPDKWDGKWRIVLYDVPEKYKKGRDALTRKLKYFSFYQLQKSVWVFPFECRKEIETITATYEIDKYVTYLETNYIDKQEILKEKFDL